MDIKPIRTKANYRAALKAVESLMTARAHTREGDRLDVLTTLVEAYERTHFPMDLPDAVEAIKFSSCLPQALAREMLTRRFTDAVAIDHVLSEPVRFVV